MAVTTCWVKKEQKKGDVGHALTVESIQVEEVPFILYGYLSQNYSLMRPFEIRLLYTLTNTSFSSILASISWNAIEVNKVCSSGYLERVHQSSC